MLKDTVEGRSGSIEEKLATILQQFGVDKMGDILDSTQSEVDFTDLYIRSIVNPRGIDLYTDKMEQEIKEKMEKIEEVKELLKYEKILDKSMVSEINKLPIVHWTRTMYTNYHFAKGREVSAIEKEMVDFNHTSVQEILQRDEYWIYSEEIPVLRIADLNYERGIWSLWEIGINENVKERSFSIILK